MTALTLFAGALLATMVFLNGYLGSFVGALGASLVVHVVGFIVSLVFYLFLPRPRITPLPWWAYGAGLFGALAVVLISTSVNSPLNVSGTITLSFAGQVIFGELMNLVEGRPFLGEKLRLALIVSGAGLVIYG